MKSCPACKREFQEDDNFCNQCGYALQHGAAANATTQVPPPPYPYARYGVSIPSAMCYYPRKSVAASILLTIFFGPLGLFYTTAEGALIMCVVTFFSMFTGIGLLIAWPACVVWGAMAAEAYNRRLDGWAFGRPVYPVW